MSTTLIQPTINFNQTVTANSAWGDTIEKKEDSSFCIYFQNVNGIQPTYIDRWEHILQALMITYNSDITALCETCLNWQKYNIRTIINNKLKKTITNNINILHSQNTATSTTAFLPGGTLVLTKGSWTGRISELLHDPGMMGRWTGNKYRLQGNRSIYVLLAYRPCPSPPHAVLPQSNSTFSQQYFKMRGLGILEPNPRLQFVEGLITYIQDLKIDKDDILFVMLDANEVLGKEKQGIIQLVNTLGLVNVFTINQMTPCNIPTHVKGKQRIDYMLGTPNLLQYINKIGYLPFHHKITADHRALYINVSINLIDNKICIPQ